ncbi:transcriptional regulator, luxR family [Mycobacteroides abscessus subsp. abscessus]|nr:transcriptional regulator, luxR family [Mycobacteroides abscessus subsp. abscessus]
MKTRELLTHVQEAYVSLSKMGLVIVSAKGEYLTSVSGIDPVTEYLFINEEMAFRQQINQVVTSSTITKPITYLLLHKGEITGLKIAIVPVKVDGTIYGYILTSVFVERNISKEHLLSVFKDRKWEEAVKTMKVLSIDETDGLLDTLQKMASVCSAFFVKELETKYFQSMQRLLLHMNRENLQIASLFEELYENIDDVDLLCYVTQNRNDHWILEHLKGKNEESLSHLKLEMISDLLNSARDKGEYQRIENIQFDPRLSFLYAYEIKPKSVYFFPINNELDTQGAIILISEQKEKLSRKNLQVIDVIRRMFSVYQAKRQLKLVGFHHLTMLSRVIDMSKLMIDLKSVRELLFLILDMTDHLVKDSIAIVVMRDETYESVNGDELTKNQLDVYIKDVSESLFQGQSETHNRIRNVSFGSMIECPIIVNQQIEAVLCVKVEKVTTEVEVYLEILSNLLSIGMVKFFESSKEQTGNNQSLQVPDSIKSLLTNRENEILQWMLKGYNNQEIADVLFISAHTVKNHISNIFQKLNITDRRQLFSTIYQLHFYT